MSLLVPSRLVLIYGDSIALGYNASDRTHLGWTGRLRPLGYAPVVDAGDGRTLFSEVASAADAKVLVRRWMRWRPTDVWIAIGTNDAFSGASSAAAFSTQYGYVLDELEARAPHVQVYAQTPIVRVGENSATPDPLSSYRTAIGTLCGTRPRVVLVDGTALVSLGDLDVADGTHPTDAGHLVYATNAASILALP